MQSRKHIKVITILLSVCPARHSVIISRSTAMTVKMIKIWLAHRVSLRSARPVTWSNICRVDVIAESVYAISISGNFFSLNCFLIKAAKETTDRLSALREIWDASSGFQGNKRGIERMSRIFHKPIQMEKVPR